MNKLSDWIKGCNTNEISDNQIFPFDHEGNKIMLVKKDGKIFALDRICTHAEADPVSYTHLTLQTTPYV